MRGKTRSIMLLFFILASMACPAYAAEKGAGIYIPIANLNKFDKTLKGHEGIVRSLAFSPDGKQVASGGDDSNVIIWNASKGDAERVLKGHGSYVASVSFGADGSLTTWSGKPENATIVWDARTGQRLNTIVGRPSGPINVAYTPDKKILASWNSGFIMLWNVKSGEKIMSLGVGGDPIYAAAFSPDGKVLASGGEDKTVRLWDVKTGQVIKTLEAHEDAVYTVAFSPDGRMLASGARDSNIIMWNLVGVYLANFIEKGEFETTKEYEKRLSRIFIPYVFEAKLGVYDADAVSFEAELSGNKVYVKVPREKARDMIDRKEDVYVEGKMRYFSSDVVDLVEPFLVDRATSEKYAVATSPENFVAYVPKPVMVREVAENVHEIPDFKARPREQDVAVVIGIEEYRGLPKSEYSSGDAGIIKDYLKAIGFQERNISFLTDASASLSDIQKSVESWLPNKVKNDSTVFVYYSGHGAPDPVTGDAYIVPYDGDPGYLHETAYSLKKLYEGLGKLQVAEVMVVLDSCFSGAGGRSVLAKGARPLVMMSDEQTLPSHMAVLSSTQGSQIAASSTDKGHGIFTYYLLKALKHDKKDLVEIYDYIKPMIEDEAKSMNVLQSPSLMPSPGTIKGRFSLRK